MYKSRQCCISKDSRTVYAVADIARGEEIFTNYGYRIGGKRVPQWYSELYVQETGRKWPTQNNSEPNGRKKYNHQRLNTGPQKCSS